jgi:excinuclease UvrABC nuclease subunit
MLSRRFNHPEWPLPDLVSIDGGEAQRKVALDIFKNTPVISVVKDDRHKAKEILGVKAEEYIWKPRERDIFMLNAECHRYTISFHKNLRSRNMFR